MLTVNPDSTSVKVSLQVAVRMAPVLRPLQSEAFDPVFIDDSRIFEDDLERSESVGVRAAWIRLDRRIQLFSLDFLPKWPAHTRLRLTALLTNLNLIVGRLWKRDDLLDVE